MWTITYILTIVLVNYGFSVVPLIPLPTGDMFPPLSLVVGLIFVCRDFAQREVGHYVLGAMLVAGVLSWFMANPYIAVASVSAFAISELTDWAVYSFTRKPFPQRVLLSSAIGTPVDSAVFLAMIGAFSVTGVVVMTLSKMLGALLVFLFIRRRMEFA